MAVTEIWHNPRCSKSRQTLSLLEARAAVTVRLYLKEPPDEVELQAVLAMLGKSAAEFIRKGEGVFRDLGLSVHDTEETLIRAMVEHPILVERPLVLAQGKAALGRPPEAVLDIL